MSYATHLSMYPYSSPSSDGVVSHSGTPATKLTDYSPDDARSDLKPTPNVPDSCGIPPPFSLLGFQTKALVLGNSSNTEVKSPDPFGSDYRSPLKGNQNAVPKLSPTAEAFTPRLSLVEPSDKLDLGQSVQVLS